MKDSGSKTYRIECQYDAIGMLGDAEHRRFIAGDFASDMEIKIGDRLAFDGGMYPESVPGFYLGKVVDLAKFSDKNIYLRCFNELEKNPEVSFKFEEDVNRQMKIIDSIKKGNTFFAGVFRKYTPKTYSGIYIIND